MNKVVLTALAILVSVNARAAFVFSEIPWNTPAQAVVKKLKGAGFKQVKKDKSGDYRFRGRLMNHDATGVAMMSQGKLARVVIMLATADDVAHDTYNELRSVLAEKYGAPARTAVSFLDPFHEGDGYEAEAIRAGKGIFLTQWSDGGETLTLNITSSLAVAVTYESSAWGAELARRKPF